MKPEKVERFARFAQAQGLPVSILTEFAQLDGRIEGITPGAVHLEGAQAARFDTVRWIGFPEGTEF